LWKSGKAGDANNVAGGRDDRRQSLVVVMIDLREVGHLRARRLGAAVQLAAGCARFCLNLMLSVRCVAAGRRGRPGSWSSRFVPRVWLSVPNGTRHSGPCDTPPEMLNSNWSPPGSSLTDAAANARTTVFTIIGTIKGQIDEAKNLLRDSEAERKHPSTSDDDSSPCPRVSRPGSRPQR
jgi:hypothetical protein